jgi:hypothetical protein
MVAYGKGFKCSSLRMGGQLWLTLAIFRRFESLTCMFFCATADMFMTGGQLWLTLPGTYLPKVRITHLYVLLRYREYVCATANFVVWILLYNCLQTLTCRRAGSTLKSLERNSLIQPNTHDFFSHGINMSHVTPGRLS